MNTMIELWRIAAETKDYKACDLSGGGAAKLAGRWNAESQHVIYCAKTISLAALETTAHLSGAGLPLNRFVVRIDIPVALWDARTILERESLDAAWCAIPHGRASIDAGSDWYCSGNSALLEVPSAIVDEECAIIINAKHPDTQYITARTIRRFDYNHFVRAGIAMPA